MRLIRFHRHMSWDTGLRTAPRHEVVVAAALRYSSMLAAAESAQDKVGQEWRLGLWPTVDYLLVPLEARI